MYLTDLKNPTDVRVIWKEYLGKKIAATMVVVQSLNNPDLSH
jgi:hypothetical protein